MIEMKMRKLLYLVLGASCLLSACTEAEKPKSDLRAPAYPLVTIDPYTSAWSTTDNLYDSLFIEILSLAGSNIDIETLDRSDFLCRSIFPAT